MTVGPRGGEGPSSAVLAVEGAGDLDDFLDRALEYGKSRLGVEGSVFLFNGGTETLELRGRTRPNADPRPSLRPGEGAVGIAYQRREATVVSGELLERVFVSWGGRGCEDLRAIGCLPSFCDDRVQAVFCFDFKKSPAAEPLPPNAGGRLRTSTRDLFGRDQDARAVGALSMVEEEAFRELSEELGSADFGKRLWRARVHQAKLAIHVAGDGPARQQQAVAKYLETVLGSLKKAKKRPPDMAYIQAVDRRRGTIRTVQGLGLPLTFQTSLSHSLDSDDIQARVVRERRPILIVGKHPSLDPAVYERFNHSRFVRLWLPLFPLAEVRLKSQLGRSLIDAMPDIIRWGEERREADWVEVVGDWNLDLLPALPPQELVCGTLELGFITQKSERRALSLGPLDPRGSDLPSWCAAQAYLPSASLFRASLAGNLDTIGNATADLVWPQRIRISVVMPNWRMPEIREYPADPIWRAAIPRRGEAVSPQPVTPALVEFPNSPEDGSDGARLRDDLKDVVEASIRLALHLDDRVADLYTLLDGTEAPDVAATAYPDRQLDVILHEICREAAAERCACFLFEKADEPAGQRWRQVGVPRVWQEEATGTALAECDESQDEEIARKTADNRITRYARLEDRTRELPFAAIPIDVSETAQTVLVLRFAPGRDLSAAQVFELEGCVARWRDRLMRQHLRGMALFSRWMERRREGVKAAALHCVAQACGTAHLSTFVREILDGFARGMKPRAAVLALYSFSETGPAQIECFCGLPGAEGQIEVIDSATAVAAPRPSGPLSIATPALLLAGD